MTKKITFNEDLRTQVKEAARSYLLIEDETQLDAFVDNIEETGEISAFGVGSLLDYSHLQNPKGAFYGDIEKNFPGMSEENIIEQHSAEALDIQANLCCFDTFYRGTKDNPGITIGSEVVEGAVTAGGLLITKIDHLDPRIAANFLQHYFERFNEREYPKDMPIYKFELRDIELHNGIMKKGLVCMADEDGPLYIRNHENQYVQEKGMQYYMPDTPEGHEKAAKIISEAAGKTSNPVTGEQKPRGKVTNLDYLKNVMHDHMERQLKIPENTLCTYETALKYRENLDTTIRKTLENNECIGAKSNTLSIAALFIALARNHNQAIETYNFEFSQKVA